MPLYDYRCGYGHTFEAIKPHEKDRVPCPFCIRIAFRQFPNRFAIVAPTANLRVKHRLYREATAEAEHHQQQVVADLERPAAVPPLWELAKERARQLDADGAPVLAAKE